uniref:Uncharacterized protein n=1 Tax=Anguilla anguilla TaxID=7936 RepID=A0A0E9TQ40_ANGAN
MPTAQVSLLNFKCR